MGRGRLPLPRLHVREPALFVCRRYRYRCRGIQGASNTLWFWDGRESRRPLRVCKLLLNLVPPLASLIGKRPLRREL